MSSLRIVQRDMEAEPPRCASCGDVIGTYEPVVIVEEGSMRTTSLAREPELIEGPSALVHAACASALVPAADGQS